MAKRIMREFRLDKIAAVDRPCQEGALAVIMKRDFSSDQRDHLANTGAAMPDGSFPIQNTADLKNAIHAIGRAKDPAKARAHIISRARSLGATDMLPDGWVGKSDTGLRKDHDMTEAELKKRVEDAVKAATADLQKKLDEANETIKKMGPGKKKPGNAAEDALDGGADDAEETPAKAKKFADAVDKAVKDELAKRAEIAKSDESFEYAGKTIRKSVVGDDVFTVMKAQADTIEMAEFTKRAEGEFKHLTGEPLAKAKALRAVAKMGKEDREAIEAMLKAGEIAMADRLTVKGADGGAPVGSAQAQLEKLAETRATEKKITKSAAYAEVLETPEGKDLYAKADQEKRAA